MYLDNWNFNKNPFDSVTTSDSVFISKSFNEAIKKIEYSIQQNKELALLSGDYGSGKTTLINYINNVITDQKYYVINIKNPFGLIDDFYPFLLSELKQKNIESTPSAQKSQLNVVLNKLAAEYKKLIIMIDDAHLIKELSIYDRLKLLADFKYENTNFIFILFVGYLDVKNTIKNIPQIEQRLFVNCELENFSNDETKKYIRHRLKAAGVEFEIFNVAVEEEIYKISNGNPQTINTICERCLIKANDLNHKIIDLDIYNRIDTPETKPQIDIDPGTVSFYEILMKATIDKYTLATLNQPFLIEDIWEITDQLITMLQSDKNILKKALNKDKNYSIESHSVNVAIICAYIGLKLIPDITKLKILIAAALIHDIGMIKIPNNIYNKEKVLSNTEIKHLRLHPRFGNAIIKNLLKHDQNLIKQSIANIVLQEHEREGGIGYPYNLTTSQIDQLALLLGLCDTFEALIHARPWRKPLHPTEAIKAIFQLNNKYFNSQLKKNFINRLTFYPIGSIVQLNTGAIGEVIETNEENLIRPIIKIMSSSIQEQQNTDEVINLLESPLIQISKIK